MATPELLLFEISHYCEKARWALDHHCIAFTERSLAPGPHGPVLRRLGAPASSVPVLRCDGGPVQGSAAIIDWCDVHGGDPVRTLTPPALEEEARALEARLDDELGVQVRRHAYSAMLFEDPAWVRQRFQRTVSRGQALVLGLMWPVLRRIMTKSMDLGPQQRLDSRDRISAELDWLDELLVDGRSYLVGDRFTRADLAAASLLAPIARPPERPGQDQGPLPGTLAEDVEEWCARPSIEWVLGMYRRHRPTT